MTIHKKPTLIEALFALLPGAEMSQISRTEWRSATFQGERHVVDMRLGGACGLERADAFRAMLPTHGFDLRRFIVADIFADNIAECDGEICLRIEALLLDD